MPLFPEDKPESFDMAAARRLAHIMLDARRAMVRQEHWDDWAAVISRLRRGSRGIEAVGEDRITKVIDWLSEHVRDKYCPLIYSATTFRKKFASLEAAMLRSIGDQIEISPRTKELVLDLQSRRNWPMKLEPIVERQVQFYEQWCAFLKAERLERGDKVYDFIISRLKPTMPYVKQWMLEAWSAISSFESWSGNFDSFMMGPDNKKFRKDMATLAQGYGKAAPWTISLFERFAEHEDRKV